MSDDAAPRIRINEDGPYLVSGALPLSEQALTVDPSGNTWDYEPLRELEAPDTFALCRCGHSQDKPFCDGSHARSDFDGTEVASREPFAEQARFSTARHSTWRTRRLSARSRASATGMGGSGTRSPRRMSPSAAASSPTKRRIVRADGSSHENTSSPARVEIEYAPSIVFIEDPQQDASGPIWVRGGVLITGADGADYEQRNRVTLCRCGQSKNKPFCDGTHAHIGFKAKAPSP